MKLNKLNLKSESGNKDGYRNEHKIRNKDNIKMGIELIYKNEIINIRMKLNVRIKHQRQR